MLLDIDVSTVPPMISSSLSLTLALLLGTRELIRNRYACLPLLFVITTIIAGCCYLGCACAYMSLIGILEVGGTLRSGGDRGALIKYVFRSTITLQYFLS